MKLEPIRDATYLIEGSKMVSARTDEGFTSNAEAGDAASIGREVRN